MSVDADPKLFTEAEVQALIAAATAPLMAKIEALELRISDEDLGFTCFAIDASRGSGVVKELLGVDYAGVIVCDYFSAYRKCWEDMEHVQMQFCWSHLIRDLKFLLTLPGAIALKYGHRVLKVVRRMFALWHRRFDLGESNSTTSSSNRSKPRSATDTATRHSSTEGREQLRGGDVSQTTV